MYRCDHCGKGTIVGKSGAHRYGGGWAMRAPKKRKLWKPNLHNYRMGQNGKSTSLRLCTKCLRRAKKQNQSHRSATAISI